MLMWFKLSFLLHLLCLVAGRITRTTCWAGGGCIQQNSANTWCYIPVSGVTRATTCTGASADLQTVLETHLQQGLSVAYYNGAGNAILPGGADASVPDPPGVIRLCMSGQSGDGNFQTTCINVDKDNDIPAGRLPGCTAIRAQNNVTDGCYDPNFILTTATPTTLSTRAPTDADGTPTVTGSASKVTVTTTATVTRRPSSASRLEQQSSAFVFGIFTTLVFLYHSI